MRLDLKFKEIDCSFKPSFVEGAGQFDDGYREGYDKGSSESYPNGYNDGKADGITEGYENGKSEGIEEGYANGKSDGLTEGYRNGYDVGYPTGYNVGKTDGIAEGYNLGIVDGKEQGIEEGSAVATKILDGTIVEFRNSTVTKLKHYSFTYCSKLSSVYIPNVKEISSYAFQYCNVLTSLKLPKVTTLGSYAIASNPILASVDLSIIPKLGSAPFYNSFSLVAVIIRTPTLCTATSSTLFQGCYHILGTKNTGYNPNGDKDGYIYVPRALVDSYKTATNWVTFADQIRAIEDYPEITGG